MSKLLVTCALLLACFAVGASRAADVPKAKVAPSVKTPAPKRAPLGDAVVFKGERLDAVLAAIRDGAGVNMVVAWPALEAAGIKRDFPVDLQLRRVSAAQLLKAVLATASAGLEGDLRLGYAIEDGIVKIATLKELKAGAVRETRVYDTRDLAQVPHFTDAPSMDVTTVTGGAK